MKHIDKIGGVLFAVLAVLVIVVKPFPALSSQAQNVLGGLLVTIGIWIFKPARLTYSMGAFFLAFFALVQGLPPSVVFSGFTQSALWTLVPALFFGFVLQKTGLGKRVALGIIKLFKPTYPSILLAWVLIGVALSILTPSITVRVAIVMPIAVQCCELFALEKKSRGNSLILLTAFAMALMPGSGWLTGALWGPIIQGLFNADPAMSGLVTFSSWFSVAFLPMEIVTVLLVVLGYFVLRPKEKLPKDAIDKLKAERGLPATRAEKAAACILIGVFVLFLTKSIHGIPDAAVCMLAVIFFYLTGVMSAAEFSSGISWDLAIFIGMALSLSSIFSFTGISTWISGIIVPALAPIARNPWIFMFTVTIIVFAWRFIDIALTIPTMAILTPILPAVFTAYHISPLVWILVYVMAGNSFFLLYQNMWALMAGAIARDRVWQPSHLARYGAVYFAACMIALLVSIPVFIRAGLF